MLKRIFPLICFWFAISFPAYADINTAPLLRYQTWHGEREIDALGPLFSYTSGPKHKLFAFRPLFSYERNDQTVSWDIFYPVIWYKKDSSGTSFHFFPFISTGTNYKEIFPFFWGKTREGERYGGFFPFYGKMKQRYDRDEIEFFLWPLYIHSSKGEFHTTHFLWPVFTFTNGPQRRAFKFFPLYGYDTKEGEFEKHYLFWPIFIWQKTRLNTDRPQSYFSVFPFWVSEKSPEMCSYTFLWPFFRYYRNRYYRHYDFPWPLLGYSRDKAVKSFSLLPLVKYEESKHQKSVFLFYPLYKYEIEKKKNETITTTYILFINRYERWFKNGKLYFKLVRFWPFFYYRLDEDREKTYFPAIIPIEDPGFERVLAPIFRIYYHEKDSAGNVYTTWFWGLYSYHKEGKKETYHLFPLFNWEKTPEKKRLSLLAGLFQSITNKKSHYLKVLYLFNFKLNK